MMFYNFGFIEMYQFWKQNVFKNINVRTRLLEYNMFFICISYLHLTHYYNT